MWPWSKFREYEKQIASLKLDVSMLTQQLNRLTDRDKRGRFTRKEPK